MVDQSAATHVRTSEGEYITARAHDYHGWFVVVARLDGVPFVAHVQPDGDRVIGAGATVNQSTGALGITVPLTLPLRAFTASAEEEPFVDEILKEEEEGCQAGLDLIGSFFDCAFLRDCTPIPGPVGTSLGLGAPFMCKSSVSKGLTWWSGNTVEYREQYTTKPLNQHPWFTELADWDYRSQGCAPPETIEAWNQDVPGTDNDLDYTRCYDFRPDGPRARLVIYTITVHWSDHTSQTARYERWERYVSDLWYHDHSLMTPNHYVQSMEMVESLGPNQFVGNYRFGRAFRDWHYQR